MDDVAGAPGPRVADGAWGSPGCLRRLRIRSAVPVAVACATAVVATVVATIGPKAAPAVGVDGNVLEAISVRSGDATNRVVLPAQPGSIAMAPSG